MIFLSDTKFPRGESTFSGRSAQYSGVSAPEKKLLFYIIMMIDGWKDFISLLHVSKRPNTKDKNHFHAKSAVTL